MVKKQDHNPKYLRLNEWLGLALTSPTSSRFSSLSLLRAGREVNATMPSLGHLFRVCNPSLLLFLFPVMDIEPKISHRLGKYPNMELYSLLIF